MAQMLGRCSATATAAAIVGRCLVTLMATALISGTAFAYDVRIDNFRVLENGATVLDDPFSSGVAPPDGPLGGATYATTSGTFIGGATTVEMTTANGDSNIFGGTQFIRHDAILPTNITSTNKLTAGDTFAVEGLFDLSLPTNPRESYGVLLTDRTPTNDGNDQLEMRLIKTAMGQLAIEFQRVTYNPDTTTHIAGNPLAQVLINAGVDPVTDDLTDDKLLLRLEKKDASSDAITASYRYFSDSTGISDYLTTGMITGLTELATTADIFHGELYTRAGFYARVAMAVPTPASLILFGFGLAAFGIARRRRR